LDVDLPTGTVTFLFTDIEGSTRLLRELGEAYGPVQDDQMRLMRGAFTEGGGTVIRTEGDAFFVVFPTAGGAVLAAASAQRAFASHAWSHGRPLRVRMGIHTGEGPLGGDDYMGIDVSQAASATTTSLAERTSRPWRSFERSARSVVRRRRCWIWRTRSGCPRARWPRSH
jgi:class 3 adenylate cyclase